MNHPLRRELLELIAADDELRSRLAADGSLFDGYNSEMEALHRANAARLREIVAEHGWPGRSLAGQDGAAAAWRIAQHAIGEPDFMRSCAKLVREAVATGEAEPSHLAFLEDRIRTFEGRPQLYGTQYDWNEALDAMVPMGGVEDGVEDRRRAVGLPPIAWSHPPPAGEPPPPQTFEERRREMEEWARRAGWRG